MASLAESAEWLQAVEHLVRSRGGAINMATIGQLCPLPPGARIDLRTAIEALPHLFVVEASTSNVSCTVRSAPPSVPPAAIGSLQSALPAALSAPLAGVATPRAPGATAEESLLSMLLKEDTAAPRDWRCWKCTLVNAAGAACVACADPAPPMMLPPPPPAPAMDEPPPPPPAPAVDEADGNAWLKKVVALVRSRGGVCDLGEISRISPQPEWRLRTKTGRWLRATLEGFPGVLSVEQDPLGPCTVLLVSRPPSFWEWLDVVSALVRSRGGVCDLALIGTACPRPRGASGTLQARAQHSRSDVGGAAASMRRPILCTPGAY